MDISRLDEILKGEPRYRLLQVKKAVFGDLIESWDEAMNLPKPLRERLAAACPLAIDAEVSVSAKEDTVKALIKLSDANLIETVLMRHKGGRNTVCVSTLVGCPMGCTFCATGTMGVVRKLTVSEIVEQVVFFFRHLKKEGERVGSIVYMGMGEPFLNYENVMDSIRFMHDKEVFNIGARHFSVSTSGILDGIRRFADEDLEVNLAVSLHASNDDVRRRLMPVAQGYTIEELLDVVDAYIAKTNRKVMFEYLMIDGVNDTDEHARELAKLMRRKLYVVNLIQYNPTGRYNASSEKRMLAFKDILEKNGVEATIRHRFGRDIQGACGQLVTEKKRQENG